MSRSPQSVLVTGAAGALGSQVAKRFAAAGCRVWGSRLPGSMPVEAIPGVEWLEMDVTDAASVRAAATRVANVEAWVHCAGGFRYLMTDQASDADLDFLFDTNVRSAFLLCRELVPGMKARGFGRIVLVGARATMSPSAGMGAYAASKAGLNALVGSLADEVKAFDINVNAVLPSIIDTPANRRDMPQADFATWVPSEALAEILFSLTQPWSKPIHGALIPVSGRI